MSRRPSKHTHRVARRRDAALCPALALLLATLAMCIGYVPPNDRAERVAAPLVTVTVTPTVAHHRLGSPAEHDRCCGLPNREARAVLPVGAQPLPATLPRMPVVARAAAPSPVAVLPPARGAPDLHVLQVQRI
ncbi:hypothetical protein [Streptomyces sp. NPDC050704]|uniref:hypothetical protein n=1 Tax=Streptomyces sp. NPDC050704 TaxID=3157219 RepID=UPI00344172AF